ncbi:MAG: hypothetical protein JO149_05915, partial [Gammaproteobacteria bacterium]|nr:hypothetical protein [Gammaproteobacteria bacterium]
MAKLSINIHENLIETVDKTILWNIHSQRDGINLTYQDREYLLSVSRKILECKEESIIDKQIAINNSAIVFVSICEGDQTLACAYNQGKTFSESLILSTKKALHLIKSEIFFEKVYIEITILFNKKNLQALDEIALGINAICLEHAGRIAIFKNSVPIKHGFTLEETLVKLAKKCGIRENTINFEITKKLSVYNTIEFREDILTNKNRYGLYDLYRGNPLL